MLVFAKMLEGENGFGQFPGAGFRDRRVVVRAFLDSPFDGSLCTELMSVVYDAVIQYPTHTCPLKEGVSSSLCYANLFILQDQRICHLIGMNQASLGNEAHCCDSPNDIVNVVQVYVPRD